MQGLGNDFILLDLTQQPIQLSPAQLQFLADRKFGIGCDQILFIEAPGANNADFVYRIFNADGTEAGHCGNGARCVIQYLYTHNLATTAVATAVGVATPQIRLSIKKQVITGQKAQNNCISINMGIPQFNPAALPFQHNTSSNHVYTLTCGSEVISGGVISVGNPHFAVQLRSESELADSARLAHIAQLIQAADYFPEGVNVNFYVVMDKQHLKLRTYERGCGFTLACGTGATATACYAILQHQVEQNVTVSMPGGNLTIEWHISGEATMTGPAIEVFHGWVNI